MRLSVRLLILVAVVGVLGLIWTFGDERAARPESGNEYTIEPAIERALDPVESAPPRADTRARAASNPGGLPARGAPAAGRSPSALLLSSGSTQPVAPASVAANGATSPASSAPRRVLRESSPAPIPVETASQPASVADAAPPPEKERERASGISGSVLEKSGAPAAGVPVNLRARRVFNGSSPTASPLHATTDARGSFAFGAVAEGEYEVFTEKNDRYERASTLVRAGTDAVVLVVEPVADGLMAIRGVVEKASGGALEGVRVEAIGHTSINATTDAKGGYALRVPAGSRVEQTALRFRRSGYRDRRWTIADGLRSSDYEVIGNVRLEPDAAGVSVSGVVTSTSGSPVARAQVQLAARGRNYRAVSDGDGRFVMQNVEAGPDYRLWVRPQSGFKDGLLENVIVDGATQLGIELIPIGVATLKGRMVTPEGAPLSGFTMFLVTANAGGPRSPAVTSDGQGRFLVRDLPEGRVALQTRAAPAISVSGIELAAATADTDVTVIVDVGGHRFDGRLVTSDGEPAAGVSVSLEWSASIGTVTSRSTRQTTTDADGNFAFTQLGGGVHVVSAALAGAGSVRREHSIGAGMEPVHITLPGRRGRQ